MDDLPLLQKNDLIGFAELFRLAARNQSPDPNNVFVLIPRYDCERLARILDAARALRQIDTRPRWRNDRG